MGIHCSIIRHGFRNHSHLFIHSTKFKQYLIARNAFFRKYKAIIEDSETKIDQKYVELRNNFQSHQHR